MAWSLSEGPKWEQSVFEARPDHDPHHYFERNLETMRIALRVDPYYESYVAQDDDNVRVWRTIDRAAGYRLWVWYELDPDSKKVELKWMHRVDLADDE